MIIRKQRMTNSLRDERREMSRRSSRNYYNDARRTRRGVDACIARHAKVVKDEEVTDLIELLKSEGIEVADLVACVKAYLASSKGDKIEKEGESPDEIEESDDEVETDKDLRGEEVVSFDSKKAVGTMLKKTNDSKATTNTDVAGAWLNRYSK